MTKSCVTNTYELTTGLLDLPLPSESPFKRFTPWLKFGRGNRRSQKTDRREVRRRSNLPKAIQKRLGFKCH